MSKEQTLRELKDIKNAYEEEERCRKEIKKELDALQDIKSDYRLETPDCPSEEEFDKYEKELMRKAAMKSIGLKLAFVLLGLLLSAIVIYQNVGAGADDGGVVTVGIVFTVVFMVAFTVHCFENKGHHVGTAVASGIPLIYINTFLGVLGESLPLCILIVAVYVASVVWKTKHSKRSKEEHKAEMLKYRKEAWDKYETQVYRIKTAHFKKIAPEIKRREARIKEMESKIDACRARIRSATVIHSSDKSKRAVEFFIYVLETGRADSMKEALALFDAFEGEIARIENEAWLNAWREQQAREAQWQRDREQFWHNQAMLDAEKERAEQAKRAADELERIRKDIEEQ